MTVFSCDDLDRCAVRPALLTWLPAALPTPAESPANRASRISWRSCRDCSARPSIASVVWMPIRSSSFGPRGVLQQPISGGLQDTQVECVASSCCSLSSSSGSPARTVSLSQVRPRIFSVIVYPTATNGTIRQEGTGVAWRPLRESDQINELVMRERIGNRRMLVPLRQRVVAVSPGRRR
ncbi:hypothetical protein RHA1_ro08840 (plasmid) [Rhodococcus jostii RHA1]|uniref:Uncharacterized protein n=1 Tax=Rhodococcus jostii (strain RHA1) TaxID=101510 RepID=Q0RXV2_RHOJR|nr:hypothetical protein RHA1_ro08840 [Rhodococcus jostii RHA1]